LRIALVGKMGSGKTTATDYIKTRYNCKELAFATPIREFAKYIYGDTWHTEGRRLMQALGNLSREIDPDILIRPVKRTVMSWPDINFIVSDVRFENEVNALHWLGFKVFRLEVSDSIRFARLKARDGRLPSLEVLNHPTETSLDHIVLPVINANPGAPEFYREIDKALEAHV
jgi:hypothetical protein